jgi:transcriptional regulator with PAS, ATPase and Fis domain
MNSVSLSFPAEIPPVTATGRLLGVSAAMQEVFRLIDRVGPTEAGVLLTGESGSGKELAAKAIHECSARRDGPFLVINCGAIPAGLIEAELFGREKGSASPVQCARTPAYSNGPRAGPCCSTK